jgi:hypothetical protein
VLSPRYGVGLTILTLAMVAFAASPHPGSFGTALALEPSPPAVVWHRRHCQRCVEHSGADHRCVKCGSIPGCGPQDGGGDASGGSSAEKATGCPTGGQASAPSQATAINDVDIYNSPVRPRKVIGMMPSGSNAAFLERHPDGWCRLDKLHLFDGTTGPGWIAEDHLAVSQQKVGDKFESAACYPFCRDKCEASFGYPSWDACVIECLETTHC